MADRIRKLPSPDHPITIAPFPERIVVTVAGKIIADTTAALVLREADYRPIYYIPRQDADMAALIRSVTTSYCPYKGEASYFSIPAGGARSSDAVWTYEAPHPGMEAITGHLAFYPDRVDPAE